MIKTSQQNGRPKRAFRSVTRRGLSKGLVMVMVASLLGLVHLGAEGSVAPAEAATSRPADVPNIVQISGSSSHVLALTESGEVWGWGTNSSRQVQGRNTATTKVPVNLSEASSLDFSRFLNTNLVPDSTQTRYPYDGSGNRTPETIVQVATGYNSSFALTNYGRIISWGVDTWGQAGRATTAADAGFVTKTHSASITGTVDGPNGYFYGGDNYDSRIVELSLANQTLLARTADGRLWTWGYGTHGSLGTGSRNHVHVPLLIPAEHASGVTGIAAGEFRSAIIADRSLSDSTKVVKVWGNNSGQGLGVGLTSTYVYYPTEVPASTGVPSGADLLDVELGGHNVYVLDARNGGQVWSWGNNNSYGQLGRPGTAHVPARVQLSATANNFLTGVSAISASNNGAVVILSSGEARGWGYNSAGRFGVGTTSTQYYPAPVRNFDREGNLDNIQQVYLAPNATLFISEVTYQDGFGEVVAVGQYIALGQTASSNKSLPILVWKYEHTLKPLPSELIPPVLSADRSASWISYNSTAVGAVIDPAGDPNLSRLENNGIGGTLRWNNRIPLLLNTIGSTVSDSVFYSAESTADVPIPVNIRTSGYCSLNQTTTALTLSYGYYGAASPTSGGCYIYRSIPETAMVKAVPEEYYFIASGRQEQSITGLHDQPANVGTGDEAGIFYGLNAESARVNLPRRTDAPAALLQITYTSTTPEVCEVVQANGKPVPTGQTTSHGERYLQLNGEGNCVLEVSQPGSTYYYEPFTDSVSFTVAPGRQAQELTIPGGMTFSYTGHLSNGDLAPGAAAATLTLPATTDASKGNQPLSYALSGTGNACTFDSATRTITATGAGSCSIRATAPETTSSDPADPGFLPFDQVLNFTIAKGVQTLSTPGLFNDLTTATSAAPAAGNLPAVTSQGNPVTWSAAVGADRGIPAVSGDICTVSGSAGAQRVEAVSDASWPLPDDITSGPECVITVTQAGTANWEPLTYTETVTIDSRGVQEVTISGQTLLDFLAGKKFGDPAVTLPELTSPGGQPISYTVSGSCTYDPAGRELSFGQGGNCVVQASAPGTTDPDNAWRPLAAQITAPVAKAGQSVDSLPSLSALKSHSVSGVLPSTTQQGQSITWTVSPADVCELIGSPNQRITVHSEGSCELIGTAPGSSQYESFSFAQTFEAAINYDLLNLEVQLNADNKLEAEGQWSAASWQDYLSAYSAAVSLLPNNGGTQFAVDAAESALALARHALVDTAVLVNALAARETDDSPFTPASWNTYQAEVATAQARILRAQDADASPAVTQAEIDSAAVSLKAAHDSLTLRADFTALEHEYNLQHELSEADYSAGSWAAYQNELQAAVADPLGDASTPRNWDANQAAVDAATANLDAARTALVFTADLAELIATVEVLYAPASDFSNEDPDFLWDAFQSSLVDAQATLNNTSVSQSAVDAAAAELRLAADALRRVKQNIDGVIESAETLSYAGPAVELPATTVQGAPASYYSLTPEVCEVSGLSLRALSGGSCEISWSAPAIPHSDPALAWAALGVPQGSSNPDDMVRSHRFTVGGGFELFQNTQRLAEGAEVLQGSVVRILGAGLLPSSTVTIQIPGVVGSEVSLVVPANGEIATDFTIPADLSAGPYTLIVSGTSATGSGPAAEPVKSLTLNVKKAAETEPSRPGSPQRPVVPAAGEAPSYPEQQIPGLTETLVSGSLGGDPVRLPTLTDRGATVSYQAGPAEVCEIVNGALVIHGFGECTVSWSADFVVDESGETAEEGWPALSGSLTFGTGPGFLLMFDELRIEERDEFWVGDELVVIGSGLLPGSEVAVELHSEPVELGTAIVGSTGTVRIPVTIPEDTEPGSHELIARGTSAEGESVSASETIVILVPEIPTPEPEPESDASWLWWLAGGAGAAGLLAWWFLLWKRRREDEEN